MVHTCFCSVRASFQPPPRLLFENGRPRFHRSMRRLKIGAALCRFRDVKKLGAIVAFQDRNLTCRDCGAEFAFTAGGGEETAQTKMRNETQPPPPAPGAPPQD